MKKLTDKEIEVVCRVEYERWDSCGDSINWYDLCKIVKSLIRCLETMNDKE